jgi:hypothetical protein
MHRCPAAKNLALAYLLRTRRWIPAMRQRHKSHGNGFADLYAWRREVRHHHHIEGSRIRSDSWREDIEACRVHVGFYNLCRVHESLRSTPAMALGIADRVWTIGDLLDAALTAVPPVPTPTAPERRRQYRVIEGGKG